MLGFNTNLPYNIYNYGCLITCLAMLSKYYGKEETPLTINKKLIEKKGYTDKSGDYIPDSIEKIYSDITESRVLTPNVLSDAQINDIKSAIDYGFPVMIQLDFNPKDVDADMHFVLITDYDKNDENNFTIADPIDGTIKSLKNYLGWFRPNARKTIEQYYIYKGPVVKPILTVEELLKLDVEKKNFEGKIKKVEFYLMNGK